MNSGIMYECVSLSSCVYCCLQLYTEYISNFDKALKLLDESCKKNRAFGELVKEFEVKY